MPYRHPDLDVLRVRPQAAAFLRQYTTNLVEAPRAAFLTREGKIVASVWQLKVSEDEALLAVGRAYTGRLTAHLAKYLALSAVRFEPETGLEAVFDLTAGTWQALPAGGSGGASDDDFRRFRVERGIPEQGVDFDDEIPLCVDERLVSFDKGCYLGQEIVARVHYRGSPPKRLTVKAQGECTAAEFARMTSKVDVGGRIKGFVFV